MPFAQVLSTYVYPFFMLLGGLAVFMFGMKVMSDNLEGLGGTKVRGMLGKVSNNRFAGVGIGAGVTAIIQSSSATTVMLVGFVNVGLITLTQAASIIMGANIGTTITAQIASLGAYKDVVNITAILALSACAGVFMFTFSKKPKIQLIGQIIAGLGMLFIGMELMSTSVGHLNKDGSFEKLFANLKNPFVLLFIGIVFTALIQSSSAATGILIPLVTAKIMTPGSALFVILGTNIGTCITAILACLGTNTNAKRTAIIHLLFNVIGVLLALIPFTILFYSQDGNAMIDNFLRVISFGSDDPARKIASFHTFFNIVVTLLLLPFVNQLVYLARKIIPDKKKLSISPSIISETQLEFLDDRILQTPPVAVAQVKKEVLGMFKTTRETLRLAVQGLFENSIDYVAQVKQGEKRIDFLNKAITKYLVKISTLRITANDERFLGSLYHVVSDAERIGDYADNFANNVISMHEQGISFSEDALEEIKEMYSKVDALFKDAVYAFEKRDEKMLAEIVRRERGVDEMKEVMVKAHIERLNKGVCTAENGSIYYSIASALERVADHLTNIGFSIKSLTGSEHDNDTIIKG